MDFAEKIREIRKRKRITGKELGEMLERGRGTIWNWENGKCRPNSPWVLEKVEELWEEVSGPNWRGQVKRVEKGSVEEGGLPPFTKGLSIIEFCENPLYLNFPLLKMQRLILKAFFSLPLTKKEKKDLEELVAAGKSTWKKGEKYRELVVVAGMKGGKTTLVSVIACYVAYLLLCLADEENPWEKWGFPPGTEVYIINVATSAEQAEDTIYAQTLARIKNSPFFNELGYKDVNKTISFGETGIKIRCGHSNSASIVGKLCALVELDEASRMKDKGGKSSGEEVYRGLGRSIEPFGQDGRIVSISSPMWDGDIIMRLYRHSAEIPNMLGFKLATWEMNPRISQESLKWEFKKDPEGALRDFGADPSKPKEAYYRVPLHVEEIFEKCKTYTSPINSDGRLRDDFKGKEEFDYYLHGDPAARNDAFGLALGHRLGDRVIIDLAHAFEAKEREIDVEEVKNIILELIKRGFRIKKATFDTWGVVVVWQALKAKGIKLENLWVRKEQHDELKQAIYDDYLEGHFPKKLKDEIKALVLLKGMKVDHPSGGSKDMADAVAAVTFHCMQEEPVEVASAGKDPEPEEFGVRRRWFGGRSIYG